MTDRNPLAQLHSQLRPYWEGYSREEDEKLAQQLFYGITIRNEKTGRMHHKYLPNNSPQEREGLEALQRLLLFSCQDLSPTILTALLGTLNSDGSVWGRLVLKRPKKGRRDVAADYQINFYVERLIEKGWQTDAAVAQAKDKFGLSRKAIYEAMRRDKAIRKHKPPSEFPGFAFLSPRGT